MAAPRSSGVWALSSRVRWAFVHQRWRLVWLGGVLRLAVAVRRSRKKSTACATGHSARLPRRRGDNSPSSE